jgi:small-conductance mechanosensitive channel
MPSPYRLAASLIVALLLAAGARTLPAQEPAAPPGPAEAEVHTAPVVLDGVVLFTVRGVSAYPAEQRASQIAERIRQVAADPHLPLTDLRSVESAAGTQLRVGDRPIMLVLDSDGRLEGVSRQELAIAYLDVVRRAIDEYRRARTADRLLLAAGRAALATVLLAALVTLVLVLFRRFDSLVASRFRRHIDALEARSFEILRAERISGMLRSTLYTLRAAILVAAVYVYLQRTLALFPWTRFAAVRLASWVVEPLRTMGRAFVAKIPDLIFLAILAVVVHYGLKLLRLFFDGIGRGSIRFEGFDADWAAPTYKIVRFGVLAFAVVVAYPYIPGSDSAAFKGVSLFLGLVFSLGSSSAIANVVAGLLMTYRRAFKVGDRVRIGDVTGDVTAVRLQVTHLRTPKNEEVVIPNSVILQREVTNYSSLARTRGLILHTTVGIGYEVPWRQVEAMLLMAAERVPGLDNEPPPFVLQTALGDFAVTYELNVHCRDAHAMLPLYSALHRSILDVFNEYGVQIMTPAYVGDTPQAKVVPRDQWYALPARREDGARSGTNAAPE